MYAVLKTGGKQIRVSKGDKVRVEKLSGSVGEEIRFADVLMVGGTEEVKIGRPRLEGFVVTGKILEQDRSRKVIVYKVKRRKKFRKTIGHRQAYTQVEITEIGPSA